MSTIYKGGKFALLHVQATPNKNANSKFVDYLIESMSGRFLKKLNYLTRDESSKNKKFFYSSLKPIEV